MVDKQALLLTSVCNLSERVTALEDNIISILTKQLSNTPTGPSELSYVNIQDAIDNLLPKVVGNDDVKLEPRKEREVTNESTWNRNDEYGEKNSLETVQTTDIEMIQDILKPMSKYVVPDKPSSPTKESILGNVSDSTKGEVGNTPETGASKIDESKSQICCNVEHCNMYKTVFSKKCSLKRHYLKYHKLSEEDAVIYLKGVPREKESKTYKRRPKANRIANKLLSLNKMSSKVSSGNPYNRNCNQHEMESSILYQDDSQLSCDSSQTQVSKLYNRFCRYDGCKRTKEFTKKCNLKVHYLKLHMLSREETAILLQNVKREKTIK